MSDILDEIKEDLEKEKFFALLKKYGKYVFYVSCIILIITATVIYMNHRNEVKQLGLSKSYYNFLNNIKDGLPVDLAQEKNNIYSNLARIEYAIYLKNQSKYKDSLKQLSDVIDGSTQQEIKNLAGIHAVFIAMQSNLVEENSKLFDDLEKKISSDVPLGSLLAWSLIELEMFRNHDDKAKELLKKIDYKSADESVNLLYNVAKDSRLKMNTNVLP